MYQPPYGTVLILVYYLTLKISPPKCLMSVRNADAISIFCSEVKSLRAFTSRSLSSHLIGSGLLSDTPSFFIYLTMSFAVASST